MGTLRAFATIFAFFAVCVVCVVRRLDLITKGAKYAQRDAKITGPRLISAVFLTATVLLVSVSGRAGSTFAEYEGRLITAVEITFEGSPADQAAEAEKNNQEALLS